MQQNVTRAVLQETRLHPGHAGRNLWLDLYEARTWSKPRLRHEAADAILSVNHVM